jgi:allantoate deiminase
VLEAEGLPLGVVTAINGATRAFVTVSGMAGHAGTVPMALRRDALAAAAEMVLGIERLAAGSAAGLVATVGRIEAGPGAVNVIPGRARFSVDIRAPDDAEREAGVREMEGMIAEVAARRQVSVSMERAHDARSTRCDPALADRIEASVRRLGLPVRRLSSGAGHDAMAVAPLAPVGMLFVRCRGGISHHPAESITVEDADLGVRALLDFIRHFDGRPRRGIQAGEENGKE